MFKTFVLHLSCGGNDWKICSWPIQKIQNYFGLNVQFACWHVRTILCYVIIALARMLFECTYEMLLSTCSQLQPLHIPNSTHLSFSMGFWIVTSLTFSDNIVFNVYWSVTTLHTGYFVSNAIIMKTYRFPSYDLTAG